MIWYQLVVLALIQGITEFLPISSSGHLVLLPAVTGWPDQGRGMDVAVHVGSLLAVIVYFRRDTALLIRGGLDLLSFRSTPGAKLLLLLVAATVPAVVAGGLLDLVAPDLLRSVEIIAWTMTLGGILLYVADRYGATGRGVDGIDLRQAVLIGLAQALALVPGTSRAGITMTAARLLGYARAEAARFSMLMSVPIIAAAGLHTGVKMAASGDTVALEAAAIAVVISFFAAWAAIWALMRWLTFATFTPLVLYRLALGAALLWFVYA